MNLELILLAFVLATASGATTKDVTNKDWWKTSMFYQVYPMSFMDSDDDGKGDLKGITSKLDHFPDAGIGAIWLSPIFKSPQVDNGYDISDYRDIDPIYGTMADFDELLAEAHKRKVKVILDFVPNHSSNKHQWFIDSELKTPGFEDFYIWKSGSKEAPPNNWLSVFGGPAWTYSEIRQEWYFHQFLPEQPDLNYRNSDVKEAMEDVLKYWLDKNIDGFRIDAVPYLYEQPDQNDEPIRNPPITTDETAYDYLDHIYTKDQDENYDLVYSWREYVDKYTKENGGDEKVLMTEAYADVEKTMKYFGTSDGKKLGAHFTFNFNFISGIKKAEDVVTQAKLWLDNIPAIYTSNWVLGNHDNSRVASRYGPNNADGFNMLMAVLPGIGVTYNGEEIGQEDGEKLNNFRDPERTPFQWDDTINAGFTKGSPWLPVPDDYKTHNLKDEAAAEQSHYKVYQNLTKYVRKTEEVLKGSNEIKSIGDVVMVHRKLTGSSIVLLFNFANTQSTVDVADELFQYNTVLLTSTTSARKAGDKINVKKSIKLEPNESIILRSTSTKSSDSAAFRGIPVFLAVIYLMTRLL